ncbi:MAG TPA: hypothetical protein PKA27_03110 [Fimbriimonadaceae bacterium]|nr:hypothetical protein [Fimbriimonadaceae bacterium]
MKRLFGSLLIWAYAGLSLAATPQMVIVQEWAKPEKGQDLNVSIGNYLAQELENQGRVAPILWSITDPYFRAAIDDGILKSPSEHPTLDEAQKGTSKLKADYLLYVYAKRDKDMILARAQLFHRGRLIWQDPSKESAEEAVARRKLERLDEQARQRGVDVPQRPEHSGFRSLAVSLDSELDIENAALSLARTWGMVLASGPLKDLKPRPVAQTPDADPGTQPTVTEVPEARTVDNKDLIVEVQKALTKGNTDLAINMLRDAIDVEPFDFERRRMLIETLMATGHFEVAAGEARRAADLMPDQVELRLMAARAWLRVGDADEAQVDLNEAVVRAPDSAVTRQLLGEMSLMKQEVASAIEHFTASIDRAPKAESLFSRGVALVLSGMPKEAERDFEQAKVLGLAEDPNAQNLRFGTVSSLLDAGIAKQAIGIRDLISKARLNRKDQVVGESLGKHIAFVAGMRDLVDRVKAPKHHEVSAEHRALALSLLHQCMTEIQDFLRSGDDEVLSDATLSLGESLKHLGTARDLQKAERQSGS